ncbi:MAG: chemotaxis protein MotB [Rhodobacteraceae bacterium]|nr:chemotaxis protein MotB [Paracoccaceae bacterium]
MAGQSNAAPVIIKRKKVVIAGGHHGGAWKVAYADFVTAMMAFFMLMWLLNATTEKQRKGIADYFSPTIPINRISGGGDGAFGGDSVMSEKSLAQNGTGAAADKPTKDRQANGEAAGNTAAKAEEQERLAQVEKALLARSGESMTMERLLRHVVTKVTDEGLVIELFDLPQAPLFDTDAPTPTATLRELSKVLADVLAATENPLAVAGYVRSYPKILKDNPVWPLSADRAQAMRLLLENDGLTDNRFARVTGFADRKPLTPDPSVLRNNRLEVVLLRSNR